MYVYLLKIAETEDYDQYSFGPKEDSLGIIKLYKETELFEVNDIPDDPNSDRYLNHAGMRISRIWRDKEPFPDRILIISFVTYTDLIIPDK
jgi:hypothetical protein